MWGHWLLRAARWARNPPSPRQVMLVLAVIAACFAIWGIEQIAGFPDWLTPNRVGPRSPITF